jgi:hypothetical protein
VVVVNVRSGWRDKVMSGVLRKGMMEAGGGDQGGYDAVMKGDGDGDGDGAGDED